MTGQDDRGRGGGSEVVGSSAAGTDEKGLTPLRDLSHEAFKILTPREELILKMRYGLSEGGEHTIEEVARSFSVRPERIEQIESAALRKLRRWAKGHGDSASERRDEAREVALPPIDGDESSGSLVILPIVTPELLQAMSSHPELLQNVDSRLFERILAELLESQGYSVELQQGTKDRGIDIFALMKSGPFGPHRYLVQAKRWANAVGVAPVRELLFLQDHHRVTKASLVTTSRFTRGAWTLADEYQWKLDLRDQEKLREWVASAIAKKEDASSGAR